MDGQAVVTDSERRAVADAMSHWDWKVTLYQEEAEVAGRRGPVTILIEGGDGQLSLSTLHEIQDAFDGAVENITVDWSPKRWSSGAAELTVKFVSERIERCPDCGEPGEIAGHMTCQYPQDRP